jgi:hypothetical protein
MSEIFGQPAESVNALAAVTAVALSLVAFGLAVWTAFVQRQHNRLSVRPLAQVLVRDLDGHIQVKLCNNGTGPLIIKKLRVHKPSYKPVDSLIAAMPEEGVWRFFIGNADGRSIRPGAWINMLDLRYGSSPAEVDFAQAVRASLQHLTIHVKYCDIYRKTMPVYRKSLEWFGRTL